MIETPDSRTRRGKAPEGPSRAEHMHFFNMAMQGWEDQGLQNPSKMGDHNGEVIHDARQ